MLIISLAAMSCHLQFLQQREARERKNCPKDKAKVKRKGRRESGEIEIISPLPTPPPPSTFTLNHTWPVD